MSKPVVADSAVRDDLTVEFDPDLGAALVTYLDLKGERKRIYFPGGAVDHLIALLLSPKPILRSDGTAMSATAPIDAVAVSMALGQPPTHAGFVFQTAQGGSLAVRFETAKLTAIRDLIDGMLQAMATQGRTQH